MSRHPCSNPSDDGYQLASVPLTPICEPRLPMSILVGMAAPVAMLALPNVGNPVPCASQRPPREAVRAVGKGLFRVSSGAATPRLWRCMLMRWFSVSTALQYDSSCTICREGQECWSEDSIADSRSQ